MMPDNFTQRYARQMMLPHFGAETQALLARSTALIVGVGGLGSTLSQLLCAAGVGKLILMDADRVSESNLQRQILYRSEQIGKLKVECARESLVRLNPYVEIEAHPYFLNESNALKTAACCNIIVDACDNAPARYLMNDLSVGIGVPFVYGSISEYSGQVAVFNAKEDHATYRCLFPQAPGKDMDAPQGVMAPLPSFIASVQANECIKLLGKFQDTLANRLFVCDMLRMQSRCIDLQASENGRKISLERFRKIGA